MKKRIFISSVQAEFATERLALNEYILSDPLLGKFFEPFLFELLPATGQNTDALYLKEIEHNDIYLGIFGVDYGSENEDRVSPTEREFDYATECNRTRLVFLTNHNPNERAAKQNALINKAQAVLVRKRFSTFDELRSAVYASLVRYHEEKEIIRSGPFDASSNATATIDDIDSDKVESFVRLARSRKSFPLHESTRKEDVLTHLNLFNNGQVSNAGILLFGKRPQRFFIGSEVRCVSFHGNEVAKPNPSYKVFKGDVFQLVNQAVDFILSKLDYSIGTRAEELSIPGQYEIPKEVVAEAIVNAIAHRDYTGNGSVQVMLFKNRLEILNPGALPLGWTVEKLKQLHSSVPANPLLAEPMYYAGYIERLGTGTSDMIRLSKEAGQKEPEFSQNDSFRTIIYRPLSVIGGIGKEVTGEVSGEVREVIKALKGEMKRSELQQSVGLKHDDYFRLHYVIPALNQAIIEMTDPDSPRSPAQKYRLTEKGKAIQQKLLNDKE